MKKDDVVYIVSVLAYEVNGDTVHSMIEYVSGDKNKAEEYLNSKSENEIVNIDSTSCVLYRKIIIAKLE